MKRKNRKFLNAAFLVDGYKLLHHLMYPEGTEVVFSTFTARSNKYATIKGANGVVVSTIQYVISDLVDRFDRDFFMSDQRRWASDEELREMKAEVLDEIAREFSQYTGLEYATQHFSELWDLGYLPIEIRSMDEGTVCPIKVPYLTIHNTDKRFYWVTNYLETIISNMIWPGITTATTIRGMRSLVNDWAIKTTGSTEGTDYQLHDFSMRGLKGVDNTILSGIAFLTSSMGTDNIPAIPMIRWAYGDEGNIANGVPATEHSIMTSEGIEGEVGIMEDLINKFPNGFLSIVSDSYDYWENLTSYIPSLKAKIVARDGKYVVRPDSGNVVHIICGTVTDIRVATPMKELLVDLRDEYWDYCVQELEEENNELSDFIEYKKIGDIYYKINVKPSYGKTSNNATGEDVRYLDDVEIEIEEVEPTAEMKGSIEVLWDIFGGHVNDLGYKVLSDKIGLIYGESINYEKAAEIFEILANKGFASTNVVMGCGSYMFSMTTRDSYGQAIKSTYQVRNGVGKNIFKDPKTDDGTKKSAKGLTVARMVDGHVKLFDEQTWDDVNSDENLLKVRFRNGEFMNESYFSEVRERTSKADIFNV